MSVDINHTTIKAWKRWKAILVEAKTKEMELRVEICKKVFGGSETKDIKKFVSGDLVLKANNTTTYKIDQEALQSMWEDLSETEKNAISYVAKVKWRDLPENSILWDIITEKPTTPTLTIL